MFGLLSPCWLSTFNFAWHELMWSRDHVALLYANMLDHHGDMQKLYQQMYDHAQEDVAQLNVM
ncbi:hypothetical protein T01_3247 [Trichinella spiralis]|uniref:Uncharacterized protein n=1 Tax=Trichinella spiralis TaxID=6334 RepID=A0A0V1BYI7_TRISP|nr:hypothetical protein T01_3247 [Trichinella spiralis]